MRKLKESKENFEVIVSNADKNTTVITSVNTNAQFIEKVYSEAFDRYDPSNKTYSSVLKDLATTTDEITLAQIKDLSINPQGNLSKIIKINSLIEPVVNRNGLIGVTYDAIRRNTNDDIKITYKQYTDNVSKSKKVNKSKGIVEDFNQQINVKKFIKDSTSSAYLKGNRVTYLRGDEKTGWTIDVYPLKIALISEFTLNGDPIVLIDMKELENALKKSILVDKKNKPLFYKTLEEEIKSNYPTEVYNAYKNKEKYAKLDIERTGVIRINNFDKQYGLSPIFKSLEDYVMLETFKDSDRVNSKATAKKIIHQKLRAELLELNEGREFFGETSYAHNTLMAALSQDVVVVTSPPYVESIEYVEPKVKLTDKDSFLQYQKSFANSLGISFLSMDNGSTVTTAGISIKQLMLTINDITKEIQNVIDKFYRFVLKAHNVSLEFLPNIEIIDSELLEFELKKDLAEFLFNRLNSSYETAYGVLGYDINDEKAKRVKENEDKLDDVFYPRKTSATVSKNDDVGGRPKGEDPDKKDKQDYDKTRQDNKQ